MGLVKNMVESLRCWIEAFQVASKEESGWKLTPIGGLIFSPSTGQDPYLEDHSSNWLLHWLICSNTQYSLFAWNAYSIAGRLLNLVLQMLWKPSVANLDKTIKKHQLSR